MSKDMSNIQDAFLNHVRKSRQTVYVFLVNGVKLQGRISWFDNFCIALHGEIAGEKKTQLVYKHAVTSILPSESFQITELPGMDDIGNVE